MKNFAELNNAFNTATSTALRMGELVVHPSYQMREKMNHDVIENYVDALDELPPVNVIEVEGRKILVDGFQRYFAFERAEREELPVLLIEGTEQDALVYSMAANFEHLVSGSKPNKGDQQRAIKKVLPIAIEKAGYNAVKVVPLLKELGLTASKSTLARCSQEARDNIDIEAAREANRLRKEMSARALADELGVTRKTLSRLFALSEEWHISTMRQKNHPESVINSTPIIEEDNDDDLCPFDDDDLQEVTIVNPAEAKSKTLSTLEEGLTKDTAAPVSPVSLSSETKTEKEPVNDNKTSIIRAMQEFTFAWKHSDKEDIASFFDSETEQSEETINALLEVAEFINNTRI